MRRFLFHAAILLLIGTSLAEARIKVVGRGYQMNFDPASIPAHLQPSYDLMSRKCVLCLTMERAVIAVQRGRATITGLPLDMQVLQAST